MRSAGVVFVIYALSLHYAAAFAPTADDSPATVALLEAKAEQARPRDRCFLYAKLVSQMTDVAGSQFHSGDSGRGSETLKQVQRYAEKIHRGVARDSKKLKEAELLMRRTSLRLKDILGAASYEDRPTLAAAVEQLNQVQAELMTQVFAK